MIGSKTVRNICYKYKFVQTFMVRLINLNLFNFFSGKGNYYVIIYIPQNILGVKDFNHVINVQHLRK